MAQPKRPKLTLQAAKASRIGDLADQLIDATNVSAATVIRNLDRDRLELVLLNIVSSADERWRVRHKPTPLPAGTDDQERIRTAVAAILAQAPEAIVPVTLALSDAVAQHDPRRQDAAA